MNRLLNRKALAILCAIWVPVMVLPLQPVIFSMDLNWVSGVVILLSLMAFLNLLY